jgi:predicted HD phosphohydrolase
VVNAVDPVTEVERVLTSLRGVWDEEAVDEFDHALQAAGHAAATAPGDDELLVAALLHDLAHSPLLADPARPGRPHDEFARRWLTPRFGTRVGWLAGAHVVAKRHLAGTEPGYASALSPTSVDSLLVQGGEGAAGPEWTGHRWWPAALALRRCDDAAKDPSDSVPELGWALAAVARLAAAPAGSGRRAGDTGFARHAGNTGDVRGER